MKFSQVPANSGISREYVMIGKVGDTFRHEQILPFYKTDAIGRISNYLTNPNKSAVTKNKRMKSAVSIITMLFLFATLHGASQNVGINKTNPIEALDVNGSINLNGTIKANGAQGTPGQVLTSTGAGVVWDNMSNEFKNVRQIYTTGTTPQGYNFIVPAGVTRVMVELWGGGGGGNTGGGGAGGNYRAAIFPVVPGALISIAAASAGLGVVTGNLVGGNRQATNGGNSSVSVSGTVLAAVGGGAASLSRPGVSVRQALVTPPANFSTYYLPGTSGDAGAPLALYFPTSSVTNPNELYQAGNGGYSYSFSKMGGSGGLYYEFLQNNGLRFSWEHKEAQDAQGFGCGGGGTKSGNIVNPTSAAGNGSPGMVMLRW